MPTGKNINIHQGDQGIVQNPISDNIGTANQEPCPCHAKIIFHKYQLGQKTSKNIKTKVQHQKSRPLPVHLRHSSGLNQDIPK